MVKKFSKFLAFSLFFFIALILFMPKENFYFLLEKELQKFDVVVSEERLQERSLSLEIENLHITAKEVDSAVIERADVMLLGFYNSIFFEGIELSSIVSVYLPPKLESVKVKYSILNPFIVYVDAHGEFGEAQLHFSLLESQLQASVKPSKKMLKEYKKSMRMLQKDENGEYSYAKTF